MDAVDDDARLRHPIVIIGPPRSGTSLLASVLGEHRRLAMINEPRLTWRWGNDDRSDLLGPEDARPEVCRHVRASFAAIAREKGAERIVEKTPANALRPAFVERVLPGCLFVNILRHPYESVLSIHAEWQRAAGGGGVRRRRFGIRMRELDWRRAPRYWRELLRRVAPGRPGGWVGQPEWGPRLPGMQAMLRDLSVLEVACLQWRTCVELACGYGRALPPDRYLELRLEDLGESTLAEVLRFCGLDHDEGVWSLYRGEFDRAQASWRRERASVEELATIRRWTEPTLRWIGYEP